MKEDLILESIQAIGEHLSDKLDRSKTWNPEANRYSRAINPDLISELIRTHLKHSEIYLLFELIKVMDSSNKVGIKQFKATNLPRTTLFLAIKNLTEKGCLFEFEDGNIMINPNIATLTKYRKDCLILKNIWNKEIKKISKFNQEIEQSEMLF